MLGNVLKKHKTSSLNYFGKELNNVKKIYDGNDLKIVQVLNIQGKIQKCFFYEDNGRLSNMSEYDTNTGKEIKNTTYRKDGKTISSIREYNVNDGYLRFVAFYKEDGRSISSIIEYNKFGTEIEFSLFCDDGEVITASI